jgi:hypothetical protein
MLVIRALDRLPIDVDRRLLEIDDPQVLKRLFSVDEFHQMAQAQFLQPVPGPADVLLVVEVADTTGPYDRRRADPAMDLPIAVAALIERAPLVRRNASDLMAVPDLEVLTY